MEQDTATSGIGELVGNFMALPKNLLGAIVRHGLPNTSRASAQTVFSNLFLHIHAVRTHRWTLKKSFTLGLGVASLVSFLILGVTGLLLMVYFKPSTALAYYSVKDIQYVVPGGNLIRNVHRWSGHLMVVLVLLHMLRVALTGSYRKPREFNWIVGVILLVLTFALAFTGYCLPWDQLGYWATKIGTNIAGSPSEVINALGIKAIPDVGAIQKLGILGARTIGDDALLRFYVLHCVVLPIAIIVMIGVHFWRIRKDGGMSRPDDIEEHELAGTPVEPLAEVAFDRKKTYGLMAVIGIKTPGSDQTPEHTVQTWPHVFYHEMAVALIVLLGMLLVSVFVEAPLADIANPAVPENPAKAPWYFLGLQECVSYSAFSGGIMIPALVVIGLALFPFIDRGKSSGRLLGSNSEKCTFFSTLLVASAFTVGMLAFTVNYGWMRNWWPEVNQLWIIAINPGTVIMGFMLAYCLGILHFTRSTRLMVVALAACFIAGFTIMTYFGCVHRGPNWDFYWRMSDWPVH